MSENTICNFCSLQDMQVVAKERNVEVILDKDEEEWISARYSDESEPSRWFMKLTESCACYD